MIWRYLELCGLFLLLGASAIGVEQSAVKFRSVVVRVVNEDGKPMAGVKVQLLGTVRDALQAMDIGRSENLPGVWNFVSDAQGRCTVRFGCFSGYDSGKLVGKDMPGWGQYYFIAEGAGMRGVSLCLLHGSEPGGWSHSDHDEWERRGSVKTKPRPVILNLQMRRGLRVTGRVVDMEGRPVPNFHVGIQDDLHSTHHTGYGDEIFKDSMTSDDAGNFTFDHVFPNTFYLSGPVGEQSPPIWVRTRLRGKWLREPVDFITPRRGEKVIRLTLMVSPELPYRYFGQVTDPAGKPIAQAKMAFGISLHRKPRTYADFHNTLHTDTGEDGRYELRTVTPFVLWTKVTAPGYAEDGVDFEERHLKAPEKWNVVMHRQ